MLSKDGISNFYEIQQKLYNQWVMALRERKILKIRKIQSYFAEDSSLALQLDESLLTSSASERRKTLLFMVATMERPWKRLWRYYFSATT